MSKHMKAWIIQKSFVFRKMIFKKIIAFCQWIAVMWRRGVGTASIVDVDDSHLPRLPTLATISSPDDEYFFDEMLFDEIIISE